MRVSAGLVQPPYMMSGCGRQRPGIRPQTHLRCTLGSRVMQLALLLLLTNTSPNDKRNIVTSPPRVSPSRERSVPRRALLHQPEARRGVGAHRLRGERPADVSGRLVAHQVSLVAPQG